MNRRAFQIKDTLLVQLLLLSLVLCHLVPTFVISPHLVQTRVISPHLVQTRSIWRQSPKPKVGLRLFELRSGRRPARTGSTARVGTRSFTAPSSPWQHLGQISAASRLHPDSIKAGPRLHLSCILVGFRLDLGSDLGQISEGGLTSHPGCDTPSAISPAISPALGPRKSVPPWEPPAALGRSAAGGRDCRSPSATVYSNGILIVRDQSAAGGRDCRSLSATAHEQSAPDEEQQAATR